MCEQSKVRFVSPKTYRINPVGNEKSDAKSGQIHTIWEPLAATLVDRGFCVYLHGKAELADDDACQDNEVEDIIDNMATKSDPSGDIEEVLTKSDV